MRQAIHWMGDRSPLDHDSPWFLAIDLGSTQLSALLVNRKTRTLHPIYWFSVSAQAGATKSFGLPTSVYLSMTAPAAPAAPEDSLPAPQVTPLAVGAKADELADLNPCMGPSPTPGHAHQRILLRHLKAHVLNSTAQLKERDLQAACSVFLATLSGFRGDLLSPATVQCGAEGLTSGVVQTVLRQLGGVLVSSPLTADETYGRSLCEAILQAKLVPSRQQIGLINDGSALLAAQRWFIEPAKPPVAASAASLSVVCSTGAIATELIALQHDQVIQVQAYPYADQAIHQDVIHLLLDSLTTSVNIAVPPYVSDLDAARPPLLTASLSARDEEAIAQDGLAACLTYGLDALPRFGQLDASQRQTWQTHLDTTALGRSLQQLAQRILRSLSDHPVIQLQVGSYAGLMTRQTLDHHILWPYLQHLDPVVARLLEKLAMPPQAIEQVICGGLLYHHGAIARWLQEKFPHAQVEVARIAPPRVMPALAPPQGCDRPSPIVYGMGIVLLSPCPSLEPQT
ncbi:MAG: hypothetical protein EA367_07770 [Leptolyngbya sp. DLM2.Bin15]|nr:MAG: hypothetical protein EA367_07770 [Leptolyngbya sp. DLM2.Bin15]